MSGTDLTLTGFCGLYCGACFGYQMTVSEAAKSLRRALRSAKLKDAWGQIPMLGEYASFKKSPASTVSLHQWEEALNLKRKTA